LGLVLYFVLYCDKSVAINAGNHYKHENVCKRKLENAVLQFECPDCRGLVDYVKLKYQERRFSAIVRCPTCGCLYRLSLSENGSIISEKMEV
jgi:predicted RNA-binding Zn-ribbon protein involved in translation (DUF1610 family)